MQCSAVQFSAVQCSAVQCSAVQWRVYRSEVWSATTAFPQPGENKHGSVSQHWAGLIVLDNCTVNTGLNCTGLTCIVLYWYVYCTVMFLIVLYCPVQYCTLLYCTFFYFSLLLLLYCTVGSALLHRFGHPTKALSLKTQLSVDFPTAYRHIPNTVEPLSK